MARVCCSHCPSRSSAPATAWPTCSSAATATCGPTSSGWLRSRTSTSTAGASSMGRMKGRAVLGVEPAGLATASEEELFHPVLDNRDSDSGQIDSAVELLVRGGRDVRHAIAMLVPEAWEGARDLDSEVRG